MRHFLEKYLESRGQKVRQVAPYYTTNILLRMLDNLIKIADYEEERVKLTNTQTKKIKFATKNQTGTTLRRAKKNTFKMKNSHMNYF